jgi:hypothetical protein
MKRGMYWDMGVEWRRTYEERHHRYALRGEISKPTPIKAFVALNGDS